MVRDTPEVVENNTLVVVVVGTTEMGGSTPVMVEVEEVIDELQEKFHE